MKELLLPVAQIPKFDINVLGTVKTTMEIQRGFYFWRYLDIFPFRIEGRDGESFAPGVLQGWGR